MSRVALFEGYGVPGDGDVADDAMPLPPPRQRRRGYKRQKTSPRQASRQGRFKVCVRTCKGTGQYRSCMSTCLKRKNEVKSDPEE